jgi:peptidoglycan biosynthesis protein MviN/MurJ (putative lipid II flippase)
VDASTEDLRQAGDVKSAFVIALFGTVLWFVGAWVLGMFGGDVGSFLNVLVVFPFVIGFSYWMSSVRTPHPGRRWFVRTMVFSIMGLAVSTATTLFGLSWISAIPSTLGGMISIYGFMPMSRLLAAERGVAPKKNPPSPSPPPPQSSHD